MRLINGHKKAQKARKLSGSGLCVCFFGAQLLLNCVAILTTFSRWIYNLADPYRTLSSKT